MSELEKKLGALLRLERERQDIKLEDLVEDLRISESNLKCIEDGDVSTLPSEIYFGLFAKSYAEAIGVDYSATVQAIKEDIGEYSKQSKAHKKKSKQHTENSDTTEEPSEKFHDEQRQPNKKTTHQLLWIGIAIVLIVGGYFVLKQFFKDMKSNTGSFSDTSEVVEGPTERLPEGELESSYAEYDWNVPEYEKSDYLNLKLTARSESWAAVFADGDTAIYRNLVVGKTYEVTAKYRLTLSVAVPRMVDIELNSRIINPASPTNGRISKVKINQANIDSFMNLPEVEIGPLVKDTTASTEKTNSEPSSPSLESDIQMDTASTQEDSSNEH